MSRNGRLKAKAQNGAALRKVVKGAAGGAATGGGMNFQAAVTAIVGVHLLLGARLGWTAYGDTDIPCDVWAETQGPGDDIRYTTSDGTLIEVQAKRGLKNGPRLMKAMMSMASAVAAGSLGAGVLAVSSDSSDIIRNEFASDLKRLGEGRRDSLGKVATQIREEFSSKGLDLDTVYQKLSVQVVHGYRHDSDTLQAMQLLLEKVLESANDAEGAWTILVNEASQIIERKGRWTASGLARTLSSAGMRMASNGSPAWLADTLARAILAKPCTVPILGTSACLPREHWIQTEARVISFPQIHTRDAKEALTRYHAFGRRDPEHNREDLPTADWIGRFHPLAVITGGPGIGKSSLLRRMAMKYAADGFPVLHVSLRTVAARMSNAGLSFRETVLTLVMNEELSATPPPATIQSVRNWVLLADGLDECGQMHEQVATGLHGFATTFPEARVIVTTRPVGYLTGTLKLWRHYQLLPPEPDEAAEHLSAFVTALRPCMGETEALTDQEAREIISRTGLNSTISRSPLLLVVAAYFIAMEQRPPESRSELYTAQISRMVEHPPIGQRSDSVKVDRVLVNYVAMALGWELLRDPTARRDALIKSIATRVEIQLGVSQLTSTSFAASALNFLENIGLIESIAHGATSMLTFVHQSFAEYEAAQYLLSLPTDQKRKKFASIFRDAQWHEVLCFVAEIDGPDLLLDVSESIDLREKEMVSMLEIISRGKPSASQSLSKFVTKAWKKIISDPLQSHDLSNAFVAFSAVSPAAVASEVRPHMVDNLSPQRTTAWRSIVSAGNDFYDVIDLADAIQSAIAALSEADVSGIAQSDVALQRHVELRDFVQEGSLAILKGGDRTLVESVHHQISAIKNILTVGWKLKFDSLAESRGVKIPLGGEVETFLSAFSPTSEHNKASTVALKSFLRAMTAGSSSGPSLHAFEVVPLHLAAAFDVLGYFSRPASDAFHWRDGASNAGLREVVRALIGMSALDMRIVAAEAASALASIEVDLAPAHEVIPILKLDLPALDFGSLPALNLNIDALFTALEHDSPFMILTAERILGELGDLPQRRIERLLKVAQGDTLGAAVRLSRKIEGNKRKGLLLKRLGTGPAPGMEHVYEALVELDVEYSPALGTSIKQALLSADPMVSFWAAKMANHLAGRDEGRLDNSLLLAHDVWKQRHEPSTNQFDFITTSPRLNIMKAMRARGLLTMESLLESAGDSWPETSAFAIQELVESINGTPDQADALVARMLALQVRPAVISALLKQDVRLSPSQVQVLCALLDSPAPWKHAALGLLSPHLMSVADASEIVARHTNDPDIEFRVLLNRRMVAWH